jgi:hypothetical protein
MSRRSQIKVIQIIATLKMLVLWFSFYVKLLPVGP